MNEIATWKWDRDLIVLSSNHDETSCACVGHDVQCKSKISKGLSMFWHVMKQILEFCVRKCISVVFSIIFHHIQHANTYSWRQDDGQYDHVLHLCIWCRLNEITIWNFARLLAIRFEVHVDPYEHSLCAKFGGVWSAKWCPKPRIPSRKQKLRFYAF